MYQFLPSDEEVPEEARLPREAGLGLGKLHRILDLCGSLEAVSTTAHLHSAPFYFAKYRTLEVTASGRIPELDALIEEQAEEMLETCEEPLRNIHGDAKVSNMLFREGRVTGVLDLDTLMQGSVYDDLADCARSCCVSGDGSVCPGRIEDLLSGYAEGYGKALPGDAYEKAVKSLERHRFLLGIRYYSDLLSGANAFPGLSETQKLEKARKNLENPVKSGKIILL
jgi:aminoglycoside phosphotransferase (APT) family kinase protein